MGGGGQRGKNWDNCNRITIKNDLRNVFHGFYRNILNLSTGYVALCDLILPHMVISHPSHSAMSLALHSGHRVTLNSPYVHTKFSAFFTA